MTVVRNRNRKAPSDAASVSPGEEPAVDRPHDEVEYVGEVVDGHTAHQLSLAYRAVNQFPDLIKRHRRFVGGAAATAVISTTAIILAYRAIHARTSRGESGADALKRITEDEIERAGTLLKRIRKGKK